MSELKDFITGLVFGTLLSSADKMGINPMLLGRQASKVLGTLMGNLRHQFIDRDPPKNIEGLLKNLETVGKSPEY
ncbi:MAG: hypothetical protein WED07_00925 [Candidatus Freyarchaeum deiterrae]